MRKFYEEYPSIEILQTLSAKLTLSHNILLINKIKDMEIRKWYMKETIKTSINFRANFSLRNITNKHEYHFMLQFNIDVHIGTRFSLEFQYILCYGSTYPMGNMFPF